MLIEAFAEGLSERRNPAFLPEQLQEQVRSVQIRAADGTVHPLVKREQQLFAAQRPPLAAAPSDTTIRNLALGVVVAALHDSESPRGGLAKLAGALGAAAVVLATVTMVSGPEEQVNPLPSPGAEK